MTTAEAIAVVRKSLSDLAYDRGYSDEQIAGNELPALAALALIEQRMEEMEQTVEVYRNAEPWNQERDRKLRAAERERDEWAENSIEDVQQHRLALERSEARIAQLEEALDKISRLDTRWSHVGPEANRIARAALASGKDKP